MLCVGHSFLLSVRYKRTQLRKFFLPLCGLWKNKKKTFPFLYFSYFWGAGGVILTPNSRSFIV